MPIVDGMARKLFGPASASNHLHAIHVCSVSSADESEYDMARESRKRQAPQNAKQGLVLVTQVLEHCVCTHAHIEWYEPVGCLWMHA